MALAYWAGPEALRLIQSAGGLMPGMIRAVIGPATGPRWLAFAALDEALQDSGLLSAPAPPGRTLLVGASAGAWRMAAHATPDPLGTLARLRESYITRRLARGATPTQVSAAYKLLISDVFSGDAARHAVCHPHLRLGIITARVRGAWSQHPWMQRFRLGAALASHVCGGAGVAKLVERVLLLGEGEDTVDVPHGQVARLTTGNFRAALLASGSVPGYLDAVCIPDAPAGDYVDGGITDYHLAASFGSGGITLILHHTSTLKAQWFDKHLPWRRTAKVFLDNVLVLCPDERHIASLPGAKCPDRADFLRFASEPEERFHRWREAAARSEILARQFLNDLARGDLSSLVQPLRPSSARVGDCL